MERTTAADGTEIAYLKAGTGPPVVLVHGITDSHHEWAPILERLAGERTCLALDLRGHGESGDAEDYGALAMAADVAAVVEAEGLDSFDLVGHSLGGVVATAYAAGAEVASVTNVDQPLRLADFGAALRPLEGALRNPDTFHEALGQVFEAMHGSMLDTVTLEALLENRTQARQDVVLGVWGLVFDSTDEELDATVDAVAPAITAPYLAIHGLDPGEGYAEWLVERVPHAQVELWEDHGHYPHLVDPDRFVTRLRPHLSAAES